MITMTVPQFREFTSKVREIFPNRHDYVYRELKNITSFHTKDTYSTPHSNSVYWVVPRGTLVVYMEPSYLSKHYAEKVAPCVPEEAIQ